MSIITGVTELSPKLTVLQVLAWVGYLVIVLPPFVFALVLYGVIVYVLLRVQRSIESRVRHGEAA